MIVSNKFNRFFHAILSEILKAEKDIEVTSILSYNYSKIHTKIATIEQLKMFFKMADDKYEKNSDIDSCKNVFTKKEGFELFRFFGVPVSTTLISSSELSRHIVWIKNICNENNIHIHDESWASILQHIELRGETINEQ